MEDGPTEGELVGTTVGWLDNIEEGAAEGDKEGPWVGT